METPAGVKEREAEKERKRIAALRKKKRTKTPAGVKEREAEKERKRIASLRNKIRTESPAGKEKVPPQCVSNKLEVADVPDELKDLTELEARLLAQRYPFMKILALPRGKQAGIKGAVVNVPVIAEKVCKSLPRTPSQAGIIPLKLKRKIQYKSHVAYQNIRPGMVQAALGKLKTINKFYLATVENSEWEEQCLNEDPEIWKELTEAVTDKNIGDTEIRDLDEGRSRPAGENDDKNQNEEIDMDEEETDPRDRLRGIKYDTCVQPTDPTMSSDSIYSIAPGEGRKPISIMMDEHCEEQAFPTLFPTGQFGFQVNRCTKLSAKKYFNARLLNKDSRFARNVEYLFFAQFITEYKQVMDNISVALRKARINTDDGERVTAGLIKDPQRLNRIIFNDKAYNMLQTVRGSPPYWQSVMFKILAGVKQLGLFTWFLTLSAADLRWTDTLQAIALQQGQRLSDDDITNMSWEDKCKLLGSNPVTAARHFDHRLQCLFRDVILSDVNPLGKVKNYMYRIEFQQRGSPHAHCVLWIDQAPRHDDTEENVTEFIDQYVTCELPSDDDDELMHTLVSTLQRHSHSASCRKTGKSCRFHYPRPMASKTVVADTPSDEDPKEKQRIVKSSTEILNKVKDALEGECSDKSTVQELLHQVNISEIDYNKALGVNLKGKSIVYRRQPHEVNINSYNPVVLKAWQANMDLQFVCNPYACIHYIISYVTKDEREMGQALKEVSKSYKDSDIKHRMKEVASCFLNAREVSAQEAVYRVLGLPLHRSTFQTVFIQTDLPENRVVFLKPKSILENLDEESEDVYAQTMPQKYAHRPLILEQMTLAEFVSWYVSSYNTVQEEPQESAEFHPDLLESSAAKATPIKLMDGKGYMIKRKKPRIIRYHKFNETQEEEKYCHHMLMLYHPWRREEFDLKNGHGTYAEHYHSISQDILSKRSSLESFTEIIEHAIEEHEQLGPPEHAWDTLDTAAQQENAESQTDPPQDHPDHSFLQPSSDQTVTDVQESCIGTTIPLAIEHRPNYLSDEQYRNSVLTLNTGQYKVFSYINNWCVDLVKSRKTHVDLQPVQLCVTGGAGTGKSHLISTIYQMAIRTLKHEGSNPEAVRVLLTAPTGTAAFNIQASTLHSTFLLPLGQTKVYKKLSDQKRNTLRCKLADLDILIIDEVSMVGCDLLMTVDQRLREIKGVNKIFGGISVLAFGDLYQLAPVCQKFVFEDAADLFARLAGSLWQDNFQFAELDEIMRQKDDRAFAELLNRIRVGEQTQEDMTTLEQCIISPSDDNYPSDALHVFATNARVNEYNTEKLSKVEGPIRRCIAVDKKPSCLKSHVTSTDARFTGGLPHVLELKVGSRVMLTRNMDVTDGLVNGALGTVVDFVECNPPASNPKAVLIQFDNPTVGSALRLSIHYGTSQHTTAVPIQRIDVKFSISAKKQGLEVTRCQFPLRLCWATTIHKVQGLTVADIVVSMKSRFADGQCYVALSRVPKRSGLHLLDLHESKIRASTAVKAEMERMRTDMLLQTTYDDISAALTDKSQPVLIAVQNVRSLPAHHEDLKKMPGFENCIAISISETWLTSKHRQSNFHLQNFDQLRKDRFSSNPGGGLCMFIRSSSTYNLHAMECYMPQLEIQSAIIKPLTHPPFLLVNVYRNPKSSMNQFTKAFCHLLELANATHLPAFIVGDFNINLLTSKHSHAVQRQMQCCSFHQDVKKPTHISGSLLDHVYSNTPTNIWQSATHYSDHDVIWILASF
ncbi:uncharacterized protein LOC100890415 [Strongylocentrotus purpuratus]|uniref:ATP-dependent DNA helicase n=1 Tax=Strongylocentrotus purpuratus TaxID=7668 RepID=A0A7M7MZ79_STRPU|nr:uncharacterized protein LOC100890415 [Strongylocentrotus purpuratus]